MLAASRCSASNHTVRAVKRTRPDTSSRASSPATADIAGHAAGSQPDGTTGKEPGITCAWASMSTYAPGMIATCTASSPGTSPASVSMARGTSSRPNVCVCIRSSGNRPVSISRIASA